jgi:hypothetical protein
MRYLEKHGRDKQAKDDKLIRRMRFACWISKAADTHTHTHTHRVRNTYCFSMATVVTRSLLDVKLYVYCLPCPTYPMCSRVTGL